MVKKILSYVLIVIGLLVLALSIGPIKEWATGAFGFLESVGNIYLIGIGAVILIVGVFLLRGEGGSRKEKEVPIYKGKDVVGYRRMGK